MGEIRPKKCGGRRDGRDHLGDGSAEAGGDGCGVMSGERVSLSSCWPNVMFGFSTMPAVYSVSRTLPVHPTSACATSKNPGSQWKS